MEIFLSYGYNNINPCRRIVKKIENVHSLEFHREKPYKRKTLQESEGHLSEGHLKCLNQSFSIIFRPA